MILTQFCTHLSAYSSLDPRNTAAWCFHCIHCPAQKLKFLEIMIHQLDQLCNMNFIDNREVEVDL